MISSMGSQPNYIYRRRGELELSQEELTARLQTEGFNISRSTLSNWENGKFQPPLHDPEFRKALAKSLRLSVRDLLLVAGYEIDVARHSEEAERAAYIIDQLPPEKKNLAIGILEQFLEKS